MSQPRRSPMTGRPLTIRHSPRRRWWPRHRRRVGHRTTPSLTSSCVLPRPRTTDLDSDYGHLECVWPDCGGQSARTITSASITGTAQVGVTLSAGVTGLTGYPAPSVSYQWELAPDGSSPFTAVGTGTTYTPSAGDLGSLIRVVATANNGIGSAAVATSSGTAAASPAPAREDHRMRRPHPFPLTCRPMCRSSPVMNR